VPVNALVLVGSRVVEAVLMARLATKHAVKVRSLLVGLISLDVVALSASGLDAQSALGQDPLTNAKVARQRGK
jgi:hypothetical protein